MIKDKKIPNIELDLKEGLVVVGSDIHFPYQDDKAVDAFIDYCGFHAPEIIVINGDVLDFYKLSRFSKDPAGKNPKEEIEMARNFFETLRGMCPKAKIYYTIGNHETRLEKYILDYAPQISCLMDNVFQIIKLEDYNVIGCGSLLVNNSVIFKHGSRLGSKSGLSAIKELEAHYLSGATGHCFSEDVEILAANKGWIKVIDVQPNDIVATYNKQTGKFEWNPVKDKFVYDNYKELYHIKSPTVDLMVTDKHGLIGFNASNNKLEEFTAEELSKSNKRYNIPLACSSYIRDTGIDFSDDEIRLIVNICADASIEDNSFRWHLKKTRKINHLIELLDRLELEYSFRVQKNRNVKIRISCKDSKKYLQLFNDNIKCLPSSFATCNSKQAAIVLEEYSITDGHKNSSAKDSYQIYTNKQKEVDILQEMFVKNGMRTSVIDRDNGNFVITVNKRALTTITKQNVTLVPYTGKVSCVSVQNGTLVVRSKGKTIVTQNTHRLAKFSTRKSGRRFVWFETGCLCTLDPEYMVDPDWEQGFVTLYFENNKLTHSHIHEIVDGVVS